jgi:hypothetical protein
MVALEKKLSEGVWSFTGTNPMPYKSEAQRRAFHAKEAAGEIDPKVVKEFDRASKGKKLPERAGQRTTIPAKKKKAKS